MLNLKEIEYAKQLDEKILSELFNTDLDKAILENKELSEELKAKYTKKVIDLRIENMIKLNLIKK